MKEAEVGGIFLPSIRVPCALYLQHVHVSTISMLLDTYCHV